MDFKMNGRPMSLTKEEVEKALKDVEPEAPRDHVVKVGRKVFPMKQAFGVATKLDRLDFTTAQARNVLKRLGFEIGRLG